LIEMHANKLLWPGTSECMWRVWSITPVITMPCSAWLNEWLCLH